MSRRQFSPQRGSRIPNYCDHQLSSRQNHLGLLWRRITTIPPLLRLPFRFGYLVRKRCIESTGLQLKSLILSLQIFVISRFRAAFSKRYTLLTESLEMSSWTCKMYNTTLCTFTIILEMLTHITGPGHSLFSRLMPKSGLRRNIVGQCLLHNR